MIKIRQGVFETNSSSTHSICICTEAEYEAWKRGDKLYDYYNNKIVDLDVAKANGWGRFNTFAEWADGWLEKYCEHYTSPSGDKLVAFGEYGENY